MSYFSHISQQVVSDALNSSDVNLAVGNSYTFTGLPVSTLGVNSIQVSLFADQNCIVYVEQSPTLGTPHWDISDVYYYKASTNFGKTIQAISSYYRVVVTTNLATTTSFRLQSVLCPIADPLPRSLDVNGNLKVGSPTDEYGFNVENTPTGETRVVEPVRLVGANFEGSTIDSRFWTATATAAPAAVTQGGAQSLITSGTASGASASIFSVRRARYVSGSSMRYRAVIQLGDTGTLNNKRRWGLGWGSTAMPTVTDGAYFQLSGTTFSIVTCKGGVETVVSTFNGNLGQYTPTTNVTTYEIYWTNSKVWFIIGDVILHLVTASTATWANTMAFHIFADSLNSGIISSVTLATRVASIHRLGKYESQPIYYRISGNAATHTLKLGAGILHGIIFNNTSGTTVTLVDNITGTTPVIGLITTASTALGVWNYDLPFNTGLIIITTGNGLDATIIYE